MTLPPTAWWPCERCGESPYPNQSVRTAFGYLCNLCRGVPSPTAVPSPVQRRGQPDGLTLPARIRKARLYAGLTTNQLADRLGVTRNAVVRWEAGSRQPDTDSLTAIAGACAVGAFFGEPAQKIA